MKFHDSVSAQLKAGARLVSFFVTPSLVLNVVLDKNKKIEVLKIQKDHASNFPSFTPTYPFFHCFEREIHEQTGLSPSGHPWLKPIRFSGNKIGEINSYPFFKMEGKEIHEVGVGPIHAGVIEPGHFRFMCYGETVHHLEIQLGYQHRDLEKLLVGKDPLNLTPILETAAGDSSIAHAWTYCQAIENMCGFKCAEEINLIRKIALELERIAMHIAGLAGISTDIAFLPGSSTYGRLRTAIINSSMRVCGSRFGRGWLRPGGVLFGFDQELSKTITRILEDFQRDFIMVNDLFRNSKTVKHRLKNTGTVSPQLAIDIGLVGPSARASGVKLDHRDYVNIVTEESGDCWARSLIRIREIEESTQWILATLRKSPKLKAAIEKLKCPPNSSSFGLIEGWRGEVFHYLETNADGKVQFYKVQDPSIRNWFGLAQAVRGNPISDFPICNKSFDLSYCGNDL